MIVLNRLLNRTNLSRCASRLYSQKPFAIKKKVEEKDDPSLIRNIGILAHIDAGKTTTTERMLFFSGTIDNMGEVHHGNTVTDFMEQERQRGITITSASVTFPWDKYIINLLDTPGHIDFTMEVEQTLNVMDGAVVVLDGSAGVEAQTLTVWKQAERYGIPRLIYVNKMDRPDAGFFQSVHSVECKLKTAPVVLNIPFFNESKKLRGVTDLISMECYEWDESSSGLRFNRKKLTAEDGHVWENALKARMRLTETLVDADEELAELVLTEKESVEATSPSRLRESVRKTTASLRSFPILCGSSYKNVGVQLLMDAVVQYLPSPVSNTSSVVSHCFGNQLCARAFKIRHDKYRGPVTFLRIYSGSISKGQRIYNMRSQKKETCNKVMVAYADDYEDLEYVSKGKIAAVTGLDSTRVGDLITSSAQVFESAKKVLLSKKVVSAGSQNANDMFAVGAHVPDPVFFCSIEAPSMSYQSQLERALSELEREDPSLRVEHNEETGQIVLAGMGELHLEIIRDRIAKEYKVDADVGPLQIAYKEELVAPAKETHIVDCKVGKSPQYVKIVMSVAKCKAKKPELLLDKSPESIPNISAIFPKHLVAVKSGVESALRCGPKLRAPVVKAQFTLHWLEVGKGTSDSMIISAANHCARKAVKAGGTKLLEPFMFVDIVCPNDLMSSVLLDISRRRALIQKTDMRGTDRVIQALVPLAELLGYASILRSLTSGHASFSMEFHSYAPLEGEQEALTVKKETGFYPL